MTAMRIRNQFFAVKWHEHVKPRLTRSPHHTSDIHIGSIKQVRIIILLSLPPSTAGCRLSQHCATSPCTLFLRCRHSHFAGGLQTVLWLILGVHTQSTSKITHPSLFIEKTDQAVARSHTVSKGGSKSISTSVAIPAPMFLANVFCFQLLRPSKKQSRSALLINVDNFIGTDGL